MIKNKKHTSSYTQQTSFVLLSVVLLILAFFIFLFSQSSFDQQKIQIVKAGLSHSFNTSDLLTSAHYQSTPLADTHKRILEKIIDSKPDYQHSEITFKYPINQLFYAGRNQLTPYGEQWIKRIIQISHLKWIENQYNIEINIFMNIPLSSEYPIFPHLLSSRIEVLAQKLEQVNISFRIQKANTTNIVLRLTEKETQ